MAETKTSTTARELFELPDDGKRYELVEGELREMAPAGARHGSVAITLAILLGQYVRENRLGMMLAAETGFMISRNPDTVRAPAVSFVARERVPPRRSAGGLLGAGPCLAVEVVSPNDTAADVQSKVQMWLESGVRLVWVVYPETRSVVTYESLKEVSVLTDRDTLSGGEVVPGFELPVAGIFE